MPNKFKKRYVLGEGYPWAKGIGPYTEVALTDAQSTTWYVPFNWPEELWSKDLPRYRLVLERIDKPKKSG